MPTTDEYDHALEKRWIGGFATKEVGATGSTVISEVTIPDGFVAELIIAAVSFSGTSLLSQSRGLILKEKSGSQLNIARAAGNQNSQQPQTSGILYENDSGGDMVIQLAGFHGDTVAHDMTGHQTWREVRK